MLDTIKIDGKEYKVCDTNKTSLYNKIINNEKINGSENPNPDKKIKSIKFNNYKDYLDYIEKLEDFDKLELILEEYDSCKLFFENEIRNSELNKKIKFSRNFYTYIVNCLSEGCKYCETNEEGQCIYNEKLFNYFKKKINKIKNKNKS